MSTPLIIGKDINGTVSDTIYTAKDIVRAILPAGVALATVVPSNVDSAYFAYGSQGDVWVDIQNAATLPTTSFQSTTAELNPVSRYVNPGQTITAICDIDNPIEIFYVYERRKA